MGRVKSTVMGITVLAMVVLFSGSAMAEMGGGKTHKGGMMDKEALSAQIKTLRDSAQALQATNPDLAKGLTDLADKKAEKIQKWQDMKTKHEAMIKLLNDSAMALQTTNPDLMKELQKMTEMKKMDKDESMEMVEPKQ